MSSKIERQKQIYSLLNTREGENLSPLSPVNPDENTLQVADVLSRARFLNQVYHFHRSIIQNINAGLFIIDLDGIITFANKVAARWLYYEVDELLNKNVRELFSDENDARKFLQLISIPGKNIDNYETKFCDKTSNEIIVGIDAASFTDENNRFSGIVMLFRDLTEVYHLRNQVERMERLALLGELSAGIAHEIRNPLGGIKAAAQVLEEDLEKDDFRRELTGRIIREVDKSNRLLKEFFKFAKPTPPRPKFTDIARIIDSVYLLLAPRIKRKNIAFKEEFETHTPQVYVDETQIEQVVLNLFLNAIDVLTEGGTLSVKTEAQKPQAAKNLDQKNLFSKQELYYVNVMISDNGKGIRPEILNKIFNPFFTTKPDGLGLGLSICSRLIEENRGKIDVSSNVGEGTTFSIVLPAFVHD